MIGKQHMGITEEVLDSLGNRWEKKQGEVRWYVNDWQEMIGLEVGYYKTGNVSDVAWNGEHRSNCWFKKYVQGTKVWIDADGAVHVDWCNEDAVARAVIEAVGQRIEAVMAPAVVESAELAFAAEGETEEAEDEVGAVEVLVVRKADGKAAKVEVPDTGEDLWTCIGAAYPRSYDLMDESMVTPSEHIEGWDERFRPGEDPELAAWLQECEAVAVELDELGRVRRTIASFDGGRRWAVGKAVDAATAWIDSSGFDTSELRVEVRVGDETVWAWEDE